jgi:hypothetical protein
VKTALLSWGVVIGATSIAAGGAALVPTALRGVAEFQVARVVVHGATYLDPHEALLASGITAKASIFDDDAAWRSALRAHPLVRDTRIERELPATVHLHIEETRPVALVRTPELRAADAAGRILPLRAGGLDLDLPIVDTPAKLATLEGATATPRRAFREVTDEPTLRALALIDALDTLDPELAALVSEAKPLGGHGVQLVLRAPAGTSVLLPALPSLQDLRAVRLVLAHLTAQSAAAATGVRIDARFREQIIVARNTATNRTNAGGAR